MADSKISALDALAEVLASGDKFAVANASDLTKSYSCTMANIQTYVDANTTITEAQISDLGTTAAMVADNLSVFAATSSAQLAGVISDETGSGALVFATSPTLVTPVLGTPSSGTLNMSSITLSGTKAQFDTACSDDDFAYLGTAQGFTKLQTIDLGGTQSDSTGWGQTTNLRILEDLGASNNQFVFALQGEITGTPASNYQKNGMYIKIVNNAASGANLYDLVGTDSRAVIKAGNSTGRVWGAIGRGEVESTGDGLAHGLQAQLWNDGTDQSSVGTTTSKYGLSIDSLGSQEGTAAIWIKANTNAEWHNGLFINSTDIVVGGKAITYDGQFDILQDGTVDVLGNTIDNAAIIKSNATNVSSDAILRMGNTESIGWRNAANTNDIFLQGDASDRISIQINGTFEHRFSATAYQAGGNSILEVGSTTDSSAGAIRIGNNSLIGWRNAGNTADGTFGFNSGDEFEITGGGLEIPATEKLFLDGGGDTYIYEVATNKMGFVAGGTTAATHDSSKWQFYANSVTEEFRITASDVRIPSGNKLFLDGVLAGGDTFIQEVAANTIEIRAGNQIHWRCRGTGQIEQGLFHHATGPADANLPNETGVFWVDTDTNELKIKVKDTGGTVRNLTIGTLA